MRRNRLTFALMLGAFAAVLNETLLNIAYPDLTVRFGLPMSVIQWLTSAYMLTIGVLMPLTAFLQQWFAARTIYFAAAGMLLAGTLLCAAAPSFPLLLAGRIVQAAGTGVLLPLTVSTLLHLYRPEERGRAMGLFGLVVMTAPAIGPVLSGLIVDALSWRWLFAAVAPFALLAMSVACRHMKNTAAVTKPKADIPSILLSTLGFGGIVYGCSRAADSPWTAPETVLPLALGAAAVVLFVRRQTWLEAPVLEVRAFGTALFALAAGFMFIVMMTLIGTMILLPLYMQHVLGMTAFAAGLAMMPGGIANGLLSLAAGRLLDRFGPAVTVVPGLALLAAGMWRFGELDGSASAGDVIALHVMVLAGIACILIPAETTGLNALPPGLHPHGAAILGTIQQVAGAVGTAVYVTIMTGHARQAAPPHGTAEALAAGVQGAFDAAFLAVALALLPGLWIGLAGTRRRRAAEASRRSGA